MPDLVLTAEHLSLFVLASVTLLAFMIALNAQGVTRISISFLIATVILVMSVFAIVTHLNVKSEDELENNRKKVQSDKLALAQQLEKQKEMIEAKNERIKLEQEKSRSREMVKVVAKLNDLKALASKLKSVQLHDYSLDYSQLTARAHAMSNKVTRAEADFEVLSSELDHFKSLVPDIKTGIEKLKKSAKYYKLYYKANDERQERVREGVIRNSAQEAEKAFSVVTKIVNSTK